MVSSGHYLASAAAARILERGGNATDAGVAAGLCLNVVQPDLTNLGGVAPICVFQAGTRLVSTISGLGTWPESVNVEFFRREHGGRIPAGIHRTVVPAAIGAWLVALEEFGSLSFAEVVEPAIELATYGFAVSAVMSDSLCVPEDLVNVRSWPGNASLFLDADGNPPEEGSLFEQPDLGRLLERLVDAERNSNSRVSGIRAVYDEFYRGAIAEEIVDFVVRSGGWLSFGDMANFRPAVEPAISTSYRGYQVYSCGAWCQGPVVLETLNILEGFDIAALNPRGVEYYHLVIEALKLAFSDREAYFGDPDFVTVPLDGLLSKEYAHNRRSEISESRAIPFMPLAGNPWKFSAESLYKEAGAAAASLSAQTGRVEPDTSYVCVVDSDGNAFSATPSDPATISPVVEGLGICVSGRGMQSWTDPRHPSSIEPGKRPRLTPSPGLVVSSGEFVMPYGTPGLDVQPQAMVQFLLGVLDFEFDIQESIESPRAASYSFPLSSDPHPYEPGKLRIESRVGNEVVEGLRSLGHDVEPWPEWTGVAGSVSAVLRNQVTGRVRGGADPRRVAYATGW
ncbi:gamma-glutamyltransferase family protein [Nesterenkonia ebinurensis]|uniref:gamma-glutamyltransferase family protein n=1 Tax=Nesterenkonia ebinurensis TaxID=2608252 RepID=UPI001CC80C9E|nr:gamma-glutamyltransferase family protein [Nesterenkonia ebinurensis]